LREAGFDDDQIRRMIEAGAVRVSD
jgi:hypothetical protein